MLGISHVLFPIRYQFGPDRIYYTTLNSLIYSLFFAAELRTLRISCVMNNWNKLDHKICNSTSYLNFTNALIHFIRPSENKIFSIHDQVLINSIQDGRGVRRGTKRLWLSVFPLQLLQPQELAPKTFYLLVLTLLPHWCKISRLYLVPVPNY